ncbi:histidine kinase [Streptomyces cynarae]|uniref:Histidine kinase n=1 Tax=Streptomyces cynarae TaxID=2981134 RepID=A0ABY6DYS0_9ACTN|nr:histidine kinase [Streptomyces cynarae]UXY19500.1 histidine kinase [Streptomyces cynarae]
MLIAVLLSFLLITFLNITRQHLRPHMLIIGLVSLGLIFALQLRHSAAGAARAPGRRKLVTLGLQAALTYLPLFFFRSEWGAMAGFLAGSVLLVLPARVGWTLYGIIGLTMLCLPIEDGKPLSDSAYYAESTLLCGLVVYGFTWLTDLVVRVQATRGELARTAVANERLRFARDLHDLLGYSLSAITLKCELIHRIALSHPERAREEIESVLTISRQSLADVRMVASGYRKMSLSQEAASADSVLGAAGVDVEVDIRLGPLTPQVDTVLATVLREGITNALRHSEVGRCTIRAWEQGGQAMLSVVNDGVDPGRRDLSPHRGSGLGNLAVRLSDVGGSLIASVREDGCFEILAETPLPPAGPVAVPESESVA